MILYRSFVGPINCVYAFPETQSKRKLIIICPGLPSQPENWDLMSKLAKMGFTNLTVKYQGTWESKGYFLKDSPVKDVISVIDKIIEKKTLISLYDNSTMSLDFDEIVLFGSSFGGSVALVAGAKHNQVRKIVANAPVTDYKLHGKDKNSKEQDLEKLGSFIKRGYGRAYALEQSDWERLLIGEVDINPVKYREELSKKDLLLIHGKKDKTVSPGKTVDFFEGITSENKKLILIPDVDHFSLNNASVEILEEVEKWILK